MNEFILCVLDRENKTTEELKINADDAAGTRAVWLAADADAAAAADAAYYADVAYYADDATKGTYDDIINHFLHEYFSITGEDRGEYEKVIKESRG